MSEMPSLSYIKIINALQRLGFVVVRQKGSHIRMQKRIMNEVIKVTIPAHRPVNTNTLRQILKQINVPLDVFKVNL